MNAEQAAQVDRYIRRGLLLIRVANGFGRDIDRDLLALRSRVRALMAGAVGLGRRDQAALLREVREAIGTAYKTIAARQIANTAELIATEAAFASRTSALATYASQSALDRATANLLVLGRTQTEAWQRYADNLDDDLTQALRLANATGGNAASLLEAAVGGIDLSAAGSIAPDSSAMAKARRAARKLADAEAHAAAHAGRVAAWRAGGVNALLWIAILDPRVCPYCGVRAGKLWTIDGTPVGHEIPLNNGPPSHVGCRCLAAPMQYPPGKFPANGGPERDSFEEFLNRQGEPEQNALLGNGRAQLWRDGTITLGDLINQAGQVMTLRELRASL